MLCNERNLLKKTVAVFLNCFLTIFGRISIPAVRQIARNRQTAGEKTEKKKPLKWQNSMRVAYNFSDAPRWAIGSNPLLFYFFYYC